MYSLYFEEISRMNHTYNLPVNRVPTDLGTDRLSKFLKTILEEVSELGEVIATSHPTERLVKLADWIADMHVYLSSEAVKHGIAEGAVTAAVMKSNFSKLGLDGKPIIDSKGKFLKGPNYAPPEADIHEILFGVTRKGAYESDNEDSVESV